MRCPAWMRHQRQPRIWQASSPKSCPARRDPVWIASVQFMACLNWLLQRVGSNRVAGASARAPDSGEQPSATQAPGAEQVEHASSGANEPGEVKGAPRLESHVVDLFSVGTAVRTTTLSIKSRNAFQRRWCWVWFFLCHAGSSQSEFLQLGLDA